MQVCLASASLISSIDSAADDPSIVVFLPALDNKEDCLGGFIVASTTGDFVS